MLSKLFYFLKIHETFKPLKEANYGRCYVFEWKECEKSPLDIIDISSCPVIEEHVKIESNPVRIELDDSLIESFNELSDDELKLAFGEFTPVQSLNAYITKLSLCSITQVELSQYNVQKCCFVVLHNKCHII